MPQHLENRFLPYTPEQLFDLVADIERYPEFLPWCVGARVFRRQGNVLDADLVIGFKMLRETFTSRVSLDRPATIEVDYQKGPFKHLKNLWEFKADGNGCQIDFYIDFEFRSRVLRRIMGPLFGEAVRRMVAAFESRAAVIYGPPKSRAATA
jgi:coenzyme Q-binding protein COQ10